MITRPVIIVGSNSIHTKRYIDGIAPNCRKIIFITNQITGLELPINTEAHKINFKLSNLRACSQIARIISSYPNAIVHIHQANSYAYHTLKAIKNYKIHCKTILTTWGSDILLLPDQNRLLRYMVKFNLANSDIITSDSLFMSSRILQLCPNVHELHTINFGICEFPDHLDLSHKENIILSNRLHKPLYNIDKIITAFAKLPNTESYQLVIVAAGSETEKLKAMSMKLGLTPHQVVFTGMLTYDQLLAWYKKARIFVSIPKSDATSLSLLEAMGYGCYPVLSNLPANLEWVIDGINGTINQNSDTLSLDLQQAIALSTEKYTETTQFNYKLIAQKAVFRENIKKFLSLYS